MTEQDSSESRSRRPDQDLTGKQRRQLRGLAHHIDPVVQIGREGVGEGVIAAVSQALDDHELIKVKVLENAPIDRHEAAELLVGPTGSHLVGKLGRIVILYRQHDTDSTIKLVRR